MFRRRRDKINKANQKIYFASYVADFRNAMIKIPDTTYFQKNNRSSERLKHYIRLEVMKIGMKSLEGAMKGAIDDVNAYCLAVMFSIV